LNNFLYLQDKKRSEERTLITLKKALLNLSIVGKFVGLQWHIVTKKVTLF